MSSPAPELDALRSSLEAAGWRCTRQRRAVFAYLRDAEQEHHHPTAEEVYQAVKGTLPSLSLATVYKALEALIDCGLVTRLADGDGSARFDARGDRHYHLRCLRTGLVRDLPTAYDPDLIARLDPDLARRLAEQGFHLTGYRLELVGYFSDAGRGTPNAEPDDEGPP